MRLTSRDIEMLSLGYCEAAVDGDRLRLHRLPADMRKIYQAREAAELRARCTAGVRVRFFTDSSIVRLGLRLNGHVRASPSVSVVVDRGEPQPFAMDPASPDWEAAVDASPARRLREVDIWLPHSACAEVRFIDVDDQASVESIEMPPRGWLALGDSITQGMDASQPALTAAARIARLMDAELLNVAVGGATLETELAGAIPDWPSDIISVAYGTNDFNQCVPVAAFRDAARRLLDELGRRHPKAPVLLITPLTWADRLEPNAIGAPIERYREALLDLPEAFPFVTLAPGQILVPDDRRMFADQVHPNDAGMAEYASNLMIYMHRALSRSL